MKRRVRVQPDPDRLVVVPESGEPMVFARADAGVMLEGTWTPGPEGSRPPGASVAVLPQGRLLCRMIELPDADATQLDMALRLQVEAQQLGSMPACRTASLVLPATGGPNRVGFCVEWPIKDVPPSTRRDLPPDGDVMHAGDVSCLVALLLRGLRGPLVCVSPGHDAMSFAFRVGNATVVRCARLDASHWPVTAETTVLESALRAGLDEPAMRDLLQRLRESLAMAQAGGFGCTRADLHALSDLAQGTPADDADWWRAHALAVATALAWFGSARTLVSLREQPPGERPSRFGDFLNRISDPSLASRLVLAAVLAIALAPPLFTGARLLLLRWKVGDLAAREQAIQAHRMRVAMYGELQRRAWPMGKLMGDLACVTPEGVEWQDVNLSQDRNVSIRGTARPQDGLSGTEVILKMERQMHDSRIFDKVQKKWDAPDARGMVAFTMSAVVSRPTQRPNFAADQDFAKKTLAERRYGPEKPEDEAASDDAPPAGDALPPQPALAEDTAPPASTPAPTPAPVASGKPAEPMKTPGASKGSKKANAVSTKPPSKEEKPAAKPAVAKGATEPPAAAAEKPAEGAAPAAGEEGDATKSGRGQRRATPGASGGLARRSERNPGSSDAEYKPPPPLTDAQIAAMSLAELHDAQSKVAEARKRVPADDAATAARLKDEFYKLQAKLQEKRNAGGGGGGG